MKALCPTLVQGKYVSGCSYTCDHALAGCEYGHASAALAVLWPIELTQCGLSQEKKLHYSGKH